MSIVNVAHKETQEQFAQLRDMTRRSGVLHDAQVTQLKLWPRVIIPGCLKSEAAVSTQDGTVTFRLSIRGRQAKGFAEGVKRVADGVQWLLGDEYSVSFYVNGELFKRYERKGAKPQTKYTGTDFEAGKIVPETPWQFKTQQTRPPSSQRPKRKSAVAKKR